jgi:hypothetical protein
MVPTELKKKALKLLVKHGLVSKKTVMRKGAQEVTEKMLQSLNTLGYGAGLIPGMVIATPIKGALALGSGVARGISTPLASVADTFRVQAQRRRVNALRNALGMQR